jgi:hypothetical protein
MYYDMAFIMPKLICPCSAMIIKIATIWRNECSLPGWLSSSSVLSSYMNTPTNHRILTGSICRRQKFIQILNANHYKNPTFLGSEKLQFLVIYRLLMMEYIYGLSILTSWFKVNVARIFYQLVLGFICIVIS